jgi:multidrug resistance efflux pump
MPEKRISRPERPGLMMMEGQQAEQGTAHAKDAHRGQDAAKRGSPLDAIRKHPLAAEAALLVLVVALIGGILYMNDLQSKIFIEKAEISAPIISIGPKTPGILERFYVQEGDSISKGQRLAQVDSQILTAEVNGVVVGIKNTPGQVVTSQDAVVKMIDTSQLRVVGRVQEDKGLRDIKPGQRVVFSVDAYDAKQYQGTVSSVGVTSRQSDIVFSISDKREPKEFEVKVLFDSNAYPELKNGMSAKLWVYK